jgi:hypothetical protein
MEAQGPIIEQRRRKTMKKALSLVMAMIVMVAALGFSPGNANAAGLITYVDGRFVWGKGVVFVFAAAGYRNKDVRDASIFVGSNFHDLYCTVDKDKENIVCVAGGRLTQYAGQIGIIYLAGQIFYVTIPDKILPEVVIPAEEPLVCEEPEVLGASVVFEDNEGNSYNEFVPGDTLQEIQDRADEWVDGFFWVSHGPIHGLECGLPPQ